MQALNLKDGVETSKLLRSVRTEKLFDLILSSIKINDLVFSIILLILLASSTLCVSQSSKTIFAVSFLSFMVLYPSIYILNCFHLLKKSLVIDVSDLVKPNLYKCVIKDFNYIERLNAYGHVSYLACSIGETYLVISDLSVFKDIIATTSCAELVKDCTIVINEELLKESNRVEKQNHNIDSWKNLSITV